MKLHSDEEDVVMSGAMIWTFESNTRPFLNVTPPLSFRAGMSKDQIKEVEKQLLSDPPDFIVLDGYTEQTFLRHVIKIRDIVNESYILTKEVNGSRYVVQVYELRDNTKFL